MPFRHTIRHAIDAITLMPLRDFDYVAFAVKRRLITLFATFLFARAIATSHDAIAMPLPAPRCAC